MNPRLLSWFAIFFLFSLFTRVEAALPIENKPSIPYEVLTIKPEIKLKQIYYGELTGDPHSFEFSLETDTDFIVNLFQLKSHEEIPFSIIVVKSNDNNRGVVEMGRMSGKDGLWTADWNSVYGFRLKKAQTFELELGPGLYKLEISSPNNSGKYMIEMGNINSDNYFGLVRGVRKIQIFFDYSIFRMFLSSYIYYPIGITFLCGLFFMTWRNRNKISSIIKND